MSQSEEREQEIGRNDSATKQQAGRVLQVVEEFLKELHPGQKGLLRAGFNSRLDRDLGIDSLGRTELVSRLERAFEVQMPSEAVSRAETVRDLFNALFENGSARRQPLDASIETLVSEPAEASPEDVQSLTQLLDWHEETHPERLHINLWEAPDESIKITYGDLAQKARAVARGLRKHNLDSGDRAAIMLPTGADFFAAFFGVLYAGGVPVPIYPPARLSQIEDHLRRQAAILDNAGAKALITVSEARTLATLLRARVKSLRAVETVPSLETASGSLPPAVARGEIALLQYTSGSTGTPKGVVLHHANLLANIRAMGRALQVDSSDVLVSWLPLYHDMGLIGAWLGSLYYAAPAVIFSPLTFLTRPEQWLWAVHRHRGTITAAPNFAYELCLRKIEDKDLEGLDLHSLRIAMNGAEPVSASTVRRFISRFSRYGFQAKVMAPVYGMAENAVGLTFPPLEREPVIDRVRRDSLVRTGYAAPAETDDPKALEFVGCGRPLPGHEIRIVDSSGRELDDRHEGRLQFRGPSSTEGYFQNEAETRSLFDGAWLESGDRAYVANGDVFLTGRSKDIIIRAGRNIYPHEVEEAIGDIEGVRKGCVAVFGSTENASATENIVVVAETRETSEESRVRLRRRIGEVSGEILEMRPDEIVLVPPRTVPKTSSGKIRRSATRQLYESGQLAKGRRAVWWQMTRLTAQGLLATSRRGIKRLAETVYGLYAWGVAGLLCLTAWLLIMLLPRKSWRWAVVRRISRSILWLSGMPLEVIGLDNLPPRGVVVANHASYLDGVALCAAVPGEKAFVAKKELENQFFIGFLLKRIGSLFVERIDPSRGREDTQRALAKAQAGERLVFFPEGTFTRTAGLIDFRLGAFLIAAQADVPVIPVTLRGTRSVLRDGQWLPRRARVQVEVAEPIPPKGAGFDEALRMRDAARDAILARCGEPDLSGERAIFTDAGIEIVGSGGR